MAVRHKNKIDEHALLKGKYAYFYSPSVFNHVLTKMSSNKVVFAYQSYTLRLIIMLMLALTNHWLFSQVKKACVRSPWRLSLFP